MESTDKPEVVLVGNGPSAAIAELGGAIDSARIVVRFNAFKTAGFERHVGSRTDVWACNQAMSDTGAALRRRARSGFRVGEILLVPSSARPGFVPILIRMDLHARALFPATAVERVPSKVTARLETALGCRPTTGLIAVEHFVKFVDRVHIVGFDVLRGDACPPRHYWRGSRSNIRKAHRPDVEGAWLRRRIDEGRVALLAHRAEL